MLSAPRVRKTILTALQDHIIPALETREVAQLHVNTLCEFSEVEHWAVQDEVLPDKAPTPPLFMWRWDEGLTSSRMPFMGFVYEGIADFSVGFTEKMATERGVAGLSPVPGIVRVRLPAPLFICFDSLMPRQEGQRPFCDQSRPGFGASHIVWFHLFADELLVHYCQSSLDEIYSSHSLQIKESSIVELAKLYTTERPLLDAEGPGACIGILTTLMKRLNRYLTNSTPPFSNTSWPYENLVENPGLGPALVEGVDLPGKELYLRVREHIDLHLQSDLSWDALSAEFNLSPFYLNRIMKRCSGLTLTECVFVARIEAARRMLIFTTERIGVIAQMTGFTSIKSFSGSFQNREGYSPSEYRKCFKKTPPSQ
jgi:AraC-like DNA-binding protein